MRQQLKLLSEHINVTYKVLQETDDIEERKRIATKYNQMVNAFRDLYNQLHCQFCGSLGITPLQFIKKKYQDDVTKILNNERSQRIRQRTGDDDNVFHNVKKIKHVM